MSSLSTYEVEAHASFNEKPFKVSGPPKGQTTDFKPPMVKSGVTPSTPRTSPCMGDPKRVTRPRTGMFTHSQILTFCLTLLAGFSLTQAATGASNFGFMTVTDGAAINELGEVEIGLGSLYSTNSRRSGDLHLHFKAMDGTLQFGIRLRGTTCSYNKRTEGITFHKRVTLAGTNKDGNKFRMLKAVTFTSTLSFRQGYAELLAKLTECGVAVYKKGYLQGPSDFLNYTKEGDENEDFSVEQPPPTLEHVVTGDSAASELSRASQVYTVSPRRPDTPTHKQRMMKFFGGAHETVAKNKPKM